MTKPSMTHHGFTEPNPAAALVPNSVIVGRSLEKVIEVLLKGKEKPLFHTYLDWRQLLIPSDDNYFYRYAILPFL